MSYRSDHDAAVARGDTLEHENARLAAENARLRDVAPLADPPDRPSGVVALFIAGTVVVLVVLLFGLVITHRPQDRLDTSRDTRSDTTGSETTESARMFADHPLTTCALRLVNPHLDAEMTDPHGVAPRSVHIIEETRAPCRAEIDAFRYDRYIRGESYRALEEWSMAEDRIARSIAELVEYYRTDPYQRDGYKSAPERWAAYNRALDQRDAALRRWWWPSSQ